MTVRVEDLPVGTIIHYEAVGTSVAKLAGPYDPFPWKGDGGLQVGNDWVRLALADGAEIEEVG